MDSAKINEAKFFGFSNNNPTSVKIKSYFQIDIFDLCSNRQFHICRSTAYRFNQNKPFGA